MHTPHYAALILFLAGSSLAGPPPPPPGFTWEANETFTDEFNGTRLDLEKWYDYHPRWRGRPPARFKPRTVSVTNGMMQIRNDVLDPPERRFNMACGAVVSRTPTAHYGYYEVRMKASKISMSSTFWMSNEKATVDGVTSSHELDIVETIGVPHPAPTDDWDADWHRRMNSNTHYRRERRGPRATYSVGDHVVVSPPSPEVGEAFHVYGAWWVDARTVHFYHNDQFVYTVHPSTHVVSHPFDRPMQINMVTETYDWMPPPAVADLTNDTINTTCYDWIRSYSLVETPKPPGDQGVE